MSVARFGGAALVVAGLLVIASCVAVPPSGTTPTRPEAARRAVDALLGDGRAADVIAYVQDLAASALLTPEEAEFYRSAAMEAMQSDLDAAIDKERFGEALTLRANLAALGIDEATLPDRSMLTVSWADSIAETGFLPGALSAVMRLPNLVQLPEQDLRRYAEMARMLNDRRSVERIVEALVHNGSEVDDELVSFISSQATAGQMIGGAVTIWVNKGIRLEGGVGYPDRVIGSGFFVAPEGYVITNHHVISSEVDPEYEGYSRLFIRLSDEPAQRVPARVVSYDRVFDIALLKVEVDAPYVFSFSDVRTLDPGTPIIAIGSPVGLENSISSGIISAVGRRFLQLGDTLQIDVPVNPGNSGGPLIDQDGRLIGVVFAGLAQYQGLNFAIPGFWIQHLLPQLADEGEVVHPWLGVAVRELDEGMEVIYVAKDSPAFRAGVQVGDRLTSIAGERPRKLGNAQSVVLNHRVGELVELQLQRDGDVIERLVALGRRPYLPVEQALERDIPERLYPALYGMEVRSIGGTLQRDFVVEEVYAGSVADESGLSAEDPLVIRDFEVDEETGVAYLQIIVKKRREGFWQSGMQLPAYIETDNFL